MQYLFCSVLFTKYEVMLHLKTLRKLLKKKHNFAQISCFVNE